MTSFVNGPLSKMNRPKILVPQSREVLNKYVALHAAQLLQEGQAIQALAVFAQYGVSDNPANFNLYR